MSKLFYIHFFIFNIRCIHNSINKKILDKHKATENRLGQEEDMGRKNHWKITIARLLVIIMFLDNSSYIYASNTGLESVSQNEVTNTVDENPGVRKEEELQWVVVSENEAGVVEQQDVAATETGVAEVGTESQFHAALANQEINIIRLTEDLSSVQDGTVEVPLVLNRPLTIEGDSADRVFNMRYMGIVLGADVTFKNLRLELSALESNALLANGYKLTLENVSVICTATSLNGVDDYIPVFCGGMVGYSYTNLPKTGEQGQIILKGKCNVADLFAGNLSHMNVADSNYPGKATITIENSVTGNIGNIYGSGARESMGEYQGNLMYPGKDYAVEGEVQVDLYDVAVKKVTGYNGKVDVSYQGKDYCRNLELVAIRSLAVKGGELQPKNSSFSTDIVEKISVADGACLWLDQYSSLRMNQFQGGGNLVVGQNQDLLINEILSGCTMVYIGGKQYIDGKEYSKSEPVYGHAYIQAGVAREDNFTFVEWNSSPELNPIFVANEAGGGSWIRGSAAEGDKIAVEKIEFEQASYTYDKGNYYDFSIDIPFITTFSSDSGWDACLDGIELEVLINGQQPQTEIDDLGYVNYVVGDFRFSIYTDVYSDDIIGYLYITNDEMTGIPPEGTYRISITVPQEYAASQTAILTAEVKVVIGGKPIVQFVTYTEDVIESQIVAVGGYVTAPGNLEKTGYILEGWYTTEEISETSQKWDFDKDTIAESITLYANWIPDKYRISYDLGYEGAESIEGKEVVYDSSYGQLPTPEREGYNFLGWYINREGGESVTAETMVSIGKDHTLYARWEEKPIEEPPVAADWGEILEEDRAEFASPDEVPEDYWVAGMKDVPYEGKAITFPRLRFYYHKMLLEEKVDYTVKYSNNTNAGTAKVTFTGKGNYNGSCVRTFHITPLDLDKAIVEQSVVIVKYNGKVHKETNKVTYEISDKMVPLKAGKDFVYEYPGTNTKDKEIYDEKAFKMPGEHRVIIKGKGNYSGENSFITSIKDATLVSSLKYTIKGNSYNRGNPVEPPVLTVKHGSVVLDGYPVDSSEKVADALVELEAQGEASKYTYVYYCENNTEIGTAKITFVGIEGKGYVGTISKTYSITGNALKSAQIKKMSSSYAWNGTAIDPLVETPEREAAYLLHNGKALLGISKAQYDQMADGAVPEGEGNITKRDYDYVYELTGNTNIGTATLVLTGVNEYAGTVKKTFKITGKSISGVKVDGIDKNGYTYSGIEIQPGGATNNVDVPEGFRVYIAKTSKTEEIPLVKGTDYTISYRKNINKGTATLILTGINGYTGTKKVTFKINAYKMDDVKEEIRVSFVKGENAFPYQKNGATPEITVMVMLEDSLTGTKTEQQLEQNKDYTIKYKNNTTVGSTTKQPTITVTGKGNYSGSKNTNFIIQNSSLENVKVTASGVVYKEKANICKPTITLIDSNNKQLSVGTDYDRNIVYIYAKDVEVIQIVNRKPVSVSRYENDPVDSKDIIPIGAEIAATVTGINNYAGTEEIPSKKIVEFRFIAGDVSKASVKVGDQIYSGRELKPSKDELIVKLGGKTLEKTDYEIISYSNNIGKGTGEITIRGIGEYGGEKTVTFRINSKKIK